MRLWMHWDVVLGAWQQSSKAKFHSATAQLHSTAPQLHSSTAELHSTSPQSLHRASKVPAQSLPRASTVSCPACSDFPAVFISYLFRLVRLFPSFFQKKTLPGLALLPPIPNSEELRLILFVWRPWLFLTPFLSFSRKKSFVFFASKNGFLEHLVEIGAWAPLLEGSGEGPPKIRLVVATFWNYPSKAP